MILYCIVLYCIVLYCIVLYCIVLVNTIPSFLESPQRKVVQISGKMRLPRWRPISRLVCNCLASSFNPLEPKHPIEDLVSSLRSSLLSGWMRCLAADKRPPMYLCEGPSGLCWTVLGISKGWLSGAGREHETEPSSS